MNKKLVLILMAGLFSLGFGKISQAMNCGGNEGASEKSASTQQGAVVSNTPEASKEAVNVGNKICPVTGEKIDEKTKVTYEYQGKIYNFCCAACPEEFKKDPEKYIKKVEEEKQAEANQAK